MAKPKCPTCKKVLTGDDDTWYWIDTPYLAFCDAQCHDNYRHVVLVIGSKDFNSDALVAKVLSAVHVRQPITLLVHGSGSGADVLCDSWARRRKIPIKIHQADCDKRGADAWVVRNSEMLKEKPDLVIAFSSSNTTCDCDMLKKCQSKFIPIIFV